MGGGGEGVKRKRGAEKVDFYGFLQSRASWQQNFLALNPGAKEKGCSVNKSLAMIKKN